MRAIKTSPAIEHKNAGIPKSTHSVVERDLGLASRRDRKIALPTLEGINFERIKDIVYVEAQGNYASFRFRDGRQLLVCRTLRDIESLIRNRKQFVRVHRSFIINLNYLRKYIRGKGGIAVMEDKSNINISVGKKQHFLDSLKIYFG